MFSKKITFFVFTYNEENRIEDMLKSLHRHANNVDLDSITNEHRILRNYLYKEND